MKKLYLCSLAGVLALYFIFGIASLSGASGKPKPPPTMQIDPKIVYVAVSSSGSYNELAVADADGSNQAIR